MAKRGKNRPLTVEVKGNELVIKIGINTLAWAFERSEYNNPWDEDVADFIQTWKVEDPEQFAQDVSHEMLNEQFVDQACQDALNEGSVAIEKYGKKYEG
jgi:hypothetical protein